MSTHAPARCKQRASGPPPCCKQHDDGRDRRPGSPPERSLPSSAFEPGRSVPPHEHPHGHPGRVTRTSAEASALVFAPRAARRTGTRATRHAGVATPRRSPLDVSTPSASRYREGPSIPHEPQPPERDCRARGHGSRRNLGPKHLPDRSGSVSPRKRSWAFRLQGLAPPGDRGPSPRPILPCRWATPQTPLRLRRLAPSRQPARSDRSRSVLRALLAFAPL